MSIQAWTNSFSSRNSLFILEEWKLYQTPLYVSTHGYRQKTKCDTLLLGKNYNRLSKGNVYWVLSQFSCQNVHMLPSNFYICLFYFRHTVHFYTISQRILLLRSLFIKSQILMMYRLLPQSLAFYQLKLIPWKIRLQ